MMILRRFYAAVALCVISQAHSASPEELFARGSQFSQVKISPGGEYLSAITKHEGKNKLLILDTESFKLKHAVHFVGNAQVRTYAWVNNERIVLGKEYLKGWNDHPLYYGELMAVNADGSRPTYLFGYNSGEQQTGSHVKKNTPIRATAFILDPLPDDEKHMLVSALPWDSANSQEGKADVYKVDVYRGTRKSVTGAPISYARFLTDSKGEVRLVAGIDKNDDSKVYFRTDGDWISSDKLKLGLDKLEPLSFAGDENTFYAAGSEHGQTQGVYKINLQSGEKTKIIQESRVDPSNFWINQQTRQLYAVEYADGYPSYAFVDAKDERSQLLKSLLASLPGHQVRIVSEDRSGKLLVVFAANDRNPGDYYLLNRNTNSMRHLFPVNDGLKTETMAEVKPFDVTTRDGTKIQAYLTLPHGVEAKNLPLVVNPHGGPHGPRDFWGFDPQNQLLASQGIAVLQVNFRGSGGYGKAFEEAGYGKWGSDIQHDIIDATRQVIADGTVDKDRICIVGGSFGGYSALQSSVLAPDLFKCAIGFAGVYDLELMFKEGDIQELDMGMAYLKKVLTQDKALLQSMSPTHNVSKLKASILLVHGGNDERAPIEQYDAMADALKKANYPFKSLVMDDEGHGFYNEAHRAKYYAEMMDFLKPHLKL